MLSNKQILDNFPVNKIINKYSKSGQKQVFLIEHKEFGIIIFKIVEGESERIRREIEIVTDNNLDFVPKVLDVQSYNIEGQQGICICEEYIQGKTLREVLAEGTLNLAETMMFAENLLSIIVEMENKSIVHRDIKPENIIRGDNKLWYLIDFGIARGLNLNSLTMTEVRVGPHTPGYGAPELFQYSKKDIDSRADIFSLGVVLFEAVTGKHPFVRGDEANLNEIWYNTVTVIPRTVVLDGDVDMQFMGLIQTFMQKHVTRRPRTATKAMEWYQSVRKNIMGE